MGRIQTFDELSTRELYEILRVRSAVFVLEQNCNYVDMDGIDFRAIHVALWQGSEIVAYCRVFVDEGSGKWHIGRVLTTQRNKHYGVRLMEMAIKVAGSKGADVVEIDAQSYATGFYEKVGFEVCSDEFLIDGIKHKKMRVEV